MSAQKTRRKRIEMYWESGRKKCPLRSENAKYFLKKLENAKGTSILG
jgi:hypothetical protein